MSTPFSFNAQALANELAAVRRQLEQRLPQLRQLRRPAYAETPREAIYREDKLTLWHFKGGGPSKGGTPLLIVYALVNTVWMTDLQDDRSLVRNLLAEGQDVYLIEWGYPDAADRWLQLQDYIDGYLDRCVDAIRLRHHLPAINLLGICQGGTFSLCYAALHPGKVKNLLTMVTPVDFHAADNTLAHWVRELDVDLIVDTLGNVPAALLNWVFLTLKPMRLSQQKYVGLIEQWDNPRELSNFLRMERWIFDSPDQAGEAFRQFIKDCYQQNKLIKGELVIGEHRVDLRRITMPLLNIYAELDHLVPPGASRALAAATESRDYQELAFKGGHIGIYVSGRAQQVIAPSIGRWLDHRR